MRAWAVSTPGPVDSGPLVAIEREIPEPARGQIRLRVLACGVCRTDLHLVEGDLEPRRPLVIPGHEIVGVVDALGPEEFVTRSGDSESAPPGSHTRMASVVSVSPGRKTCACIRPSPAGTSTVDTRSMSWSMRTTSTHCPLSSTTLTSRLRCCAGIIGYRALREKLASRLEDVLVSTALADRRTSRPKSPSPKARAFMCAPARPKHASSRRSWALSRSVIPRIQGLARTPGRASILFAPVGTIVPTALASLDRGGTLAIAGIYLSDIPALNYEKHLFQERSLRSVTANTRQDGRDFLEVAAMIGVSVSGLGESSTHSVRRIGRQPTSSTNDSPVPRSWWISTRGE